MASLRRTSSTHALLLWVCHLAQNVCTALSLRRTTSRGVLRGEAFPSYTRQFTNFRAVQQLPRLRRTVLLLLRLLEMLRPS